MGPRMKYSVVLYLNPTLDLFHCSKVYSGLHTLARRGLIHLRVEPAWYDSYGPMLQVRAARAQRSRWVVCHLADHSDRFSEELLSRCHVYYKRSFHGPDTAQWRPELRVKVVPFGLNHPGATTSGKAFVLGHWLRAFLRRPSAVLRRYREHKEHL